MWIKIPDLPQAACTRVGGDLFFFDRYEANTVEMKMAKAICKHCPEKQACLDFAIANDEEHGIWGGMTTKERRRYKRRLRYV